jgi:hypothetical protein
MPGGIKRDWSRSGEAFSIPMPIPTPIPNGSNSAICYDRLITSAAEKTWQIAGAMESAGYMN